MKRLIIPTIAMMFVLVGGAAFAQDSPAPPADGSPESVFAAGNSAYEAGAYADAVARYSELTGKGIVNADLYYNLGNAYFKSEDFGHAILWYERALRLAPRNEDIHANLVMVRSMLRDQQLVTKQGGIRNAALAWHRRLTSSESAAVACIFYALFSIAALCLVFRHSPGIRAFYRRASWISPARLFGLSMTQDFVLAMVTTAVLTAVFAGSAWSKERDENAHGRGVVVSEEVAVHSGPAEDATIQFKIHEGTIVSVRDGRSGWVRVDLPGELSGWVVADTVERI